MMKAKAIAVGIMMLLGMTSFAESDAKLDISNKDNKVYAPGEQLEMSIMLKDSEDKSKEFDIIVDCNGKVEKIGTIICRNGRNYSKWLIPAKYAGKKFVIKYVNKDADIKLHSDITVLPE